MRPPAMQVSVNHYMLGPGIECFSKLVGRTGATCDRVPGVPWLTGTPGSRHTRVTGVFRGPVYKREQGVPAAEHSRVWV